MKITADNRGRIALGKLNDNSLAKMGVYNPAGTEWDVQYKDGQLTVRPWAEEPAEEWVKVGNLEPSHIGQVIGIDYDKTHTDHVTQIRPLNSKSGRYGVLEWFETGYNGTDVGRVKLQGDEPVEFGNYGIFWVKS